MLYAGLLKKVIISAVLYTKSPREVRITLHSVAAQSKVPMPESWSKQEAAGND